MIFFFARNDFCENVGTRSSFNKLNDFWLSISEHSIQYDIEKTKGEKNNITYMICWKMSLSMDKYYDVFISSIGP